MNLVKWRLPPIVSMNIRRHPPKSKTQAEKNRRLLLMDAKNETPGRRLRADARRNRKQLLDVARDLFADEGLDASLEEIARRAGVGIGTLYRHFPTRFDLVEAIYAEQMDALIALAQSLTETEEPGKAFFEWLRAEAEQMVTYRPLKIFLMDNPHGKEPSSIEWKERLLEAGGGLLKRAQRAGAVRRPITATEILHLVHGVIMAAEGWGDGDRHIDDLLAVVFDGLKAR